MEAVLFWQISVMVSILVARAFSTQTMFIVAVCWTLFTFAAVWASGLMLLQIGTAWGTVWLLTSVFGKRIGPEEKMPDLSGLNRQPNKVEQPSQTNLAASMPSGKAPNLRKSILDRAEAPLEKITGIMEDLARNLETYNKKHEANQDLFYQLAWMNGGIWSAIKIYESNRNVSEKLKDDLQLKKLYNDARILLDKSDSSEEKAVDRRIVLRGLTILPVDGISLPEQAAEERIRRLKESKMALEEAYRRVSGDSENIAKTDAILSEPLLPFLEIQMNLINNHLRLLAPAETRQENTMSTSVIASARQSTASIFSVVTRSADTIINIYEPSTAAEPTNDKKNPNAVSQSSKIGKQALTVGKALEHHKPVRPSARLSRTSTQEGNEIENYVRHLGVPHLTHFTRCENLLSILHGGLLSVEACKQQGLASTRNDLARYDGHLDGTSLSVAFPNYRMFWKYRQLAPEADWAVLLISPEVLFQKDCAFYRLNAADARMIGKPVEKMKSAQALREMFSADGASREDWLRPFDPTDPQAEVLVFQAIEPSLIEAIAFETAGARARHSPYLAGHESFYAGPRKGLFASRKQTRTS